MIEAMPADLLHLWVAYSETDPIGSWRADWRAALVSATLYNVNRAKRTDKQVQPTDLMPKFEPRSAATGTRGNQTMRTVQGWNAFKSAVKGEARTGGFGPSATQ